jgi:integrase/recombinase XerD
MDSERMKVHIRQAKGKKDRYVTLPKATLVAMRLYWATHRHPHLIFPHGRNTAAKRLAPAPMDRGGLQKSLSL